MRIIIFVKILLSFLFNYYYYKIKYQYVEMLAYKTLSKKKNCNHSAILHLLNNPITIL